jgi:uncharacterized circularly permuted ATP-grasp superfamily protein/uncharacterized alpha-E superfamily protein
MAANDLQRIGRPVSYTALVGGYRAQPGLYDEMVDADGAVRPHWRALLGELAALGPEQLASRFAAADRHLKDSGVFYRVYDESGSGERPWPLSHIPLLIPGEDWRRIKEGVLQRAQLIETILDDCYGDRRLVEDGLIPAAAIAGSPEYLRPLVGVRPVGGRHLSLYAVDLGRSPSGDWWVIRDRVQAPSGAGYALENRIALARALPNVYRAFDVARLAPFFETVRDSLTRYRRPEDAGVCLLTPGPLNETYFEHAYLARYLGFRLVEGQDLTVHDQQVYLRTIAGLRRVNVLLRRLDADFCDPLELNQRSQLGLPGLVQAVRQGKVLVANALGAGLAEAQALMSFLPALAERRLGHGLALPNLATWWCGQEAERRFVLDNLDDLVVAPAFMPRLAGLLGRGAEIVAELEPPQRKAVAEELARRGIDFVGQEVAKLSTTPVWTGSRLEPRPFLLRVFVSATEDGWTVMPGGFGLIGDRVDARAVTMQTGARSADVWVLGEGAETEATVMHPSQNIPIRRATGALPSRAADNLFWLARYLERAEATLRIARSLAARITEYGRGAHSDTAGLVEVLFKWGAVPQPVPGAFGQVAAKALYGKGPGAVPDLLRAARGAASVIRDRFPHDAWQAIDDLCAFVISSSAATPTEGQVVEKASTALRIIAAIEGFQIENMNRLSGWRFLKLGHSIERGIGICRLVRQFGKEDASADDLGVLLELAESQMTYRVRYPLGAVRGPVLDLVLLNDTNPRSLAFQLERIVGHIAALPNPRPDRSALPAAQTAMTLIREVYAQIPDMINDQQLIGIENRLMKLSNEITEGYFIYREPVTTEGRHR